MNASDWEQRAEQESVRADKAEAELAIWRRLASEQHLTIVSEDAQVRPAAMSYQKPSEIVANLLYRIGL